MRKFLGLWDLHFGFEKTILPSGRLKATPVHSAKGFETFMSFARWYKPDVVILGGDNFDMKPVSRHERGKPKPQEGQRLVEAYQKGWEYFLKPLITLPGRPEVHWFDGNHEAWAYQLADEFPGIDGMIDPYTYLELAKHRVAFHKQGEIWRFGKQGITHGDWLKSPNALMRAVSDYGSSLRMGHFHRYQVVTKKVMKDDDYVTGIIVPCMSTRKPSYNKDPMNSVVNGFLHGVVYPNGRFDDAITLIRDGKCVVGGKVFGE